jgi:signal transduction histidine kinase
MRTLKARPGWPLALLLASLAVTAIAALQAQRVARSHTATARGVLEDYAGIAAWNYQRFLAAALDSVIVGVLRPVMHYQMLGRMHRGNAPSAQWFIDAYLDPGFRYYDPDRVPAFLPRTYASFMLGSDSLAVRGEAVAANRIAGLRDTLEAHVRSVHRPDWDYGLILRPLADGIDAVAYTIMPLEAGDTAVYAFLAPPGLWRELFEATHEKAPVLPAALTGGRANRDLLDVSIRDRNGQLVFGTATALASDVAAVEPMAEPFGGLQVRAFLHSDLAADLVVGGLPRTRLPLILGLLVLAAMLAVVAARQMRREQQLARLREDFVASVSHELRTPLAQIRMMVESLRLGRFTEPDRVAWSLASIDREATRLSHLVGNVLTFSQQAGPPPLRREPVDVGAEIAETVAAFAPLAEARAVAIRTEIEPGHVASVDRESLRQVVLNLLDNALKYGPRGQTVTVRVLGNGAGVRLLVEDEGPGVPVNERESIFRDFERGEAGRASGAGGGGIGLSVVRSAVERHGGTILVEEAPGGGARFIVQVPA